MLPGVNSQGTTTRRQRSCTLWQIQEREQKPQVRTGRYPGEIFRHVRLKKAWQEVRTHADKLLAETPKGSQSSQDDRVVLAIWACMADGASVLLHSCEDNLFVILGFRARMAEGASVLLYGCEDDLFVVLAIGARIA